MLQVLYFNRPRQIIKRYDRKDSSCPMPEGNSRRQVATRLGVERTSVEQLERLKSRPTKSDSESPAAERKSLREAKHKNANLKGRPSSSRLPLSALESLFPPKVTTSVHTTWEFAEKRMKRKSRELYYRDGCVCSARLPLEKDVGCPLASERRSTRRAPFDRKRVSDAFVSNHFQVG